jgi:hypothetical protein
MQDVYPIIPHNHVSAWHHIPPAKRFGVRLTSDAVQHLAPGTLLRFYIEGPWAEDKRVAHDPLQGPRVDTIVKFTGDVNNDFPKLGPHLRVCTIHDEPYTGDCFLYSTFVFVSDPVEPRVRRE